MIWQRFPKAAMGDGSGLSRYNLFTPMDFVWILRKMKTAFEWKNWSKFSAAGSGTLQYYFPDRHIRIYKNRFHV